MPKIVFYPLGCADTTLVQLNDKRSILIDYCHKEDVFDLKGLKKHWEDNGKADFDVVAFSHADKDHVSGMEDLFWLEHAKKYQSNDRPKIKELWVPALFVTEPKLSDSALIIQKEAKHRLESGKGIRVFGLTEDLTKWLKEKHIVGAKIQKAGLLVNGFSKEKGGVEIFVHSPFSFKMDEDEEKRNNNSIVLHMTFFENSAETKFMIGADAEYETWENIVYITKENKNEKRLEWDIFGISHHCSYTALSNEKGKKKTQPTSKVKELMNKGRSNATLVSSSDPIPSEDTTQPPHFQAAEYYKELAKEKGRKDNFLVTMEHPNTKNPKPIVIEISEFGVTLESSAVPSAVATAVGSTPRFG
jgi:beta-lactamase superfamily II metal-dependent hydrolase